VLAGKGAESLIQRLTERIRSGWNEQLPVAAETEGDYLALGNCLADEAPARPETVRSALREMMRLGPLDAAPFARALAHGRYGRDLCEVANERFLLAVDLRSAGQVLALAVYCQAVGDEDTAHLAAAARSFKNLIGAPVRASRCAGAVAVAELCRRLYEEGRKQDRQACAETLREAGAALVPLVYSSEVPEQWAAAWALSALGGFRVWTPPVEPDLLGRLLELWLHSQDSEIRRMAPWAMARQVICRRDDGRRCAAVAPADLDGLLERWDELSRRREQPALLIAAWYKRRLSDEELERRAVALLMEVGERAAAISLRELLGHLRNKV
jgi:hypothetical protein